TPTTAVIIGKRAHVHALLAAPRATIWMAERSRGTGAFAAFDIVTAEHVEVKLESGFQESAPGQQGTQRLHGYVREPASSAPLIGPVPRDAILNIAVGLPLRDPGGLTNFINQVTNPQESDIPEVPVTGPVRGHLRPCDRGLSVPHGVCPGERTLRHPDISEQCAAAGQRPRRNHRARVLCQPQQLRAARQQRLLCPRPGTVARPDAADLARQRPRQLRRWHDLRRDRSGWWVSGQRLPECVSRRWLTLRDIDRSETVYWA